MDLLVRPMNTISVTAIDAGRCQYTPLVLIAEIGERWNELPGMTLVGNRFLEMLVVLAVFPVAAPLPPRPGEALHG